jgi:hypothetical protein
MPTSIGCHPQKVGHKPFRPVALYRRRLAGDQPQTLAAVFAYGISIFALSVVAVWVVHPLYR